MKSDAELRSKLFEIDRQIARESVRPKVSNLLADRSRILRTLGLSLRNYRPFNVEAFRKAIVRSEKSHDKRRMLKGLAVQLNRKLHYYGRGHRELEDLANLLKELARKAGIQVKIKSLLNAA